MENLIKKDNLTNKELESLDFYYNEHIEDLLEVDNFFIIRFIEECESVLGFSLTKHELASYLTRESMDAKFMFIDCRIEEYEKIFELMKHFNIEDYEYGYSIADYYLENNDKEKALYYYSNTFCEGFNLCHKDYFDTLEKYLTFLNKNPSEKLKKIIEASPRDDEYSFDFVHTYLLLIVNLEKFSDEYLNYINEAIKISRIVVRKYQQFNQNKASISDTPEERDLCELLVLKQEYYVHKKEYVKAFEVYKELTEEIGLSDCTRYYHARDLYYRQMLSDMSATYPELNFFEDIGYAKFKVLRDINDLTTYLGKEIELQKENGLTFKFKVTNIYKDEFTIAPLLPLIGEGGRIFTSLSKVENSLYLTNMLSH